MKRALASFAALLVALGLGCMVYAIGRSTVAGVDSGTRLWFAAPPEHLGGMASGSTICIAGIVLAAAGAAVTAFLRAGSPGRV